MSLVTFISGDGVKHEVEETSVAADIMRSNGFQEIAAEIAASVEPEPAASVDDLPETAEITYTEEDAIAQNEGLDESTAAKEAAAPKKAPAKKK